MRLAAVHPAAGVSPFVSALGAALESAAPAVRLHFQAGERVVYRGVMERIWRARGLRGAVVFPALWLMSLSRTLLAQTGTDVPFELVNELHTDLDGRTSMRWERTFRFPRAGRRFDNETFFDPVRGALIDALGRGRLEVELDVAIEDRALTLNSKRMWLRLGSLRLGLPRALMGGARLREWERPDGSLAMSLTLHAPLLGEFFGYDGSFARAGS